MAKEQLPKEQLPKEIKPRVENTKFNPIPLEDRPSPKDGSKTRWPLLSEP